MENGFARVKLYFMCGLPGERAGRPATASSTWPKRSRGWARSYGPLRDGRRPTCSNFVPKPQTPYQWTGHAAAGVFRRRPRTPAPAATIRQRHGPLSRRSNRASWRACSAAATAAWARRSSWPFAAAPPSTPGTSDFAPTSGGWRWRTRASTWSASCTRPWPADATLPWDHIGIRQGREYLQRERDAAAAQLKTEILCPGEVRSPLPPGEG